MNYHVLVLLFVFTPFANSLISLKDVGSIISFSHEVIVDLLRTWKAVGPYIQKEGPDHVNIPYINREERALLSKIAGVNRRVDGVAKVVQSVASASNFNLKQDIPSQVRLELRIDTLLELVSAINSASDIYEEITDLGYSESSSEPRLERHTLENFATSVVSHSPTSVRGVIDRLHSMIHPDPDQGNVFLHQSVLELIAKVLQEGGNSLCHVKQSPNQIIYNLYNSLQMTQLKGFTMMQFSWMLLRLYNKGNFTVESRLARERYIERLVEQASSLKEALKLADTAFWRCDPKHQVEGETYVQLTRLLQGYLQNEVDMNPQESCTENCGYYQMTKQYGCYKNNYCANQRGCKGDIVECQYIDSDMWVCQADPMTSKRRYEWIEYENGQVLGSKRSCYKKSKVDSWWRWLVWHCSFCFCICDDDSNSDRYFSLREVLSSTDDNKVITGIRFVKNNGIVQMQIQEGILENHGRINQSSTSWKPLDDYNTVGKIEGKDYMKMSYYKRALDLDDLKAPPEHVITGIKLRMIGSHLNLEIRATPFNFTSGELIEPGKKDLWLGNENTDGALTDPRTKLALETPDNPLNTILPSDIDSKHDQYLLFTHSDINRDAAQTTVPFLDAQIVAPNPPVPLAGIGIYHKGQKWFGGFIGLKVFTYDFTHHVEDNLATLDDIEEVH